MQMATTSRATRYDGVEDFGGRGGDRGLARGKKRRKRRRLMSSQRFNPMKPWRGFELYMTVKHDHCTPIWATPKIPAKHPNALISLQHARSARLSGRVRMLANAKVPEVVPKRTK